MVHLNQNQLSAAQLNDLFAQLSNLLQDNPTSSQCLSELLGTEERIMLAKRLAIIILLVENVSLYKISRTVKVSPATALDIKQKLADGHYQTILATFGKNKRNYFSILETIDTILHLGGILPHYNGLDRYRGVGGT